jgi:hypothetical protein
MHKTLNLVQQMYLLWLFSSIHIRLLKYYRYCNFSIRLTFVSSFLTDTGYFIFRVFRKVYQNLYCSTCNVLSSTEICQNIVEKHPSSQLYTLLNINRLDSDISKIKPRRCENNQILDTFFVSIIFNMLISTFDNTE